jgi:hypothetical protein
MKNVFLYSFYEINLIDKKSFTREFLYGILRAKRKLQGDIVAIYDQASRFPFLKYTTALLTMEKSEVGGNEKIIFLHQNSHVNFTL